MKVSVRISVIYTLLSVLLMGLSALVFGKETTPIDMRAVCTLVGNKLTSISFDECLQRELVESGAYTAMGRPLLYKNYPPLSGKTPNARILLIGGTHGDEYASFSVVFKWMKILDQHHSGLFHWHIIPAFNLDGLLKSPAIRMNHNGVDLNRNLNTGDWYSALLHWEQETRGNPRRYPGPTAESESETQWLVEEINAFKPDAIISVHAPYGIVDYDGPQLVKPPGTIGRLKLGDIGTFPGSLGRYAGEKLAIPVLTIELASSRYMPADQDLRNMWVDLVRWLINNITSRCSSADCAQ